MNECKNKTKKECFGLVDVSRRWVGKVQILMARKMSDAQYGVANSQIVSCCKLEGRQCA